MGLNILYYIWPKPHEQNVELVTVQLGWREFRIDTQNPLSCDTPYLQSYCKMSSEWWILTTFCRKWTTHDNARLHHDYAPIEPRIRRVMKLPKPKLSSRSTLKPSTNVMHTNWRALRTSPAQFGLLLGLGEICIFWTLFKNSWPAWPVIYVITHTPGCPRKGMGYDRFDCILWKTAAVDQVFERASAISVNRTMIYLPVCIPIFDSRIQFEVLCNSGRSPSHKICLRVHTGMIFKIGISDTK